MSRAPSAPAPTPGPTFVDFVFLLAGAGLSLFLVRLPLLRVEPQQAIADPTLQNVFAVLPGLLRLPEGIIFAVAGVPGDAVGPRPHAGADRRRMAVAVRLARHRGAQRARLLGAVAGARRARPVPHAPALLAAAGLVPVAGAVDGA